MALNLSVLLEESARSVPDKDALVIGERRMIFSELDAEAARFANALMSLGVEPGEKVAVMVPNLPEFVVAYYGILKAGAVVVPLNVLLRGPEVAYHLDDSDAVVLVAWEGVIEDARRGFEAAEHCETLVVVEEPGGDGREGRPD